MPRATPPLFHVGESELHATLPDRRRPQLSTAQLMPMVARTPMAPAASEPLYINDILMFPVENSHAYSYAHLSPNSLALRLNVLKRSLEILDERPEWVSSLSATDANNSDEDIDGRLDASGRAETPEGLADKPRDLKYLASRKSSLLNTLLRQWRAESGEDYLKLQHNASSAALSALFRPKMSRTDSLPVTRASSAAVLPEIGEYIGDGPDSILNDDLKDLIDLLEQDSSVISHNSDVASTLHDLSLSSSGGVSQKKSLLKTKLLFALATPFVETSNVSPYMWTSGSGSPALPNASSTALNLLNSIQQPQAATALGNRPFHAIYSGKHISPQSIVTVAADYPWAFKAANDLACLMFGILKSMIKNLTLIDIIAPQFRNFVTERLTQHVDSDSRGTVPTANNIIFAGEIIAISRQADGTFAWTSLWAKKRGDLIIFMFEQIPCDAFDLVVLSDAETYPDSPYMITAMEEVAGKLLTNIDFSGPAKLSMFSELLAEDLAFLASQHTEDDECDALDSAFINKKRYYTVRLNNDIIPCALSSYPLEKDDTKYELKIKVHSMPYIAGMFVVEHSSFNVLSCNKAIAKNLFGVSSHKIIGKSINSILPHFSDILNAGLADQQNQLLVSGLVLPEHFFRKYHALLLSNSSNRSADDLFFNSRGIDGLHRDGNSLHVDVQLRVILLGIFVLWVTYSRKSKRNIAKQLDKLTKSTSSLSVGSNNQLPRLKSAISSKVDLPSQMSIFPKNEGDLLEIGLSSPEISRHNSTKKPKRPATFSIPVEFIKELPTSRGTRATFTTDSLDESSNEDTDNEDHNILSSSATTAANETNGKTYYKNYTDEEMLAMENDEIEEKKRNSKFWPVVIGEKKRTKKFSEFKALKKLGEGAYGKVVLSVHKDDPAYKIIIKCIDKQRILVDTWVRDRQLGTIPSEIQIMATLNRDPHPNIMRIIDYFEDPDYYYLETPIFGNPPAIDLFDYIEVKKNMSELDCQLIFRQIVLAIYHLHKQGIVHRDIKDENIIVNEFGMIKLIDFGSAGYVKQGPFDVFVGTIDYASPEVLRGEKYDGKPQDIWALGILLYTMIYKENPFYNVDEIMDGEMRVPYVVSDLSLELIRCILERQIDRRPTITDIADHEWLHF